MIRQLHMNCSFGTSTLKKLTSKLRYSTKSIKSNVLKKTQYNFKDIIEHESEIISSAKRRCLPFENISSLKATHKIFIDANYDVSELRNERNKLSDLIKKDKNNLTDDIKVKLSENKTNLKVLEEKLILVETELYSIAQRIPNYLDESVKDEEELVQFINEPKEPLAESSNPVYDHKEIGVNLGIIDFKAAAKIAGNSWYYLLGDGALLEQALIQYTLKLARKKGFKMVIPPSIVKSEITGACGFQPRDQNNEQQIYELTNDELCLAGTAEIPLAGLNINRIFEPNQLPEKLVGVSRSYRAEAGARGKDTKGLYRVHEFTKVELFVWTDTLESSKIELAKLKDFQIEIISSLGLTAKVLNMPASDLGAPAYKKYDIEAWMPGRGSWGELTSSSNCTDYQSRRMNTKYKNNEGKLLFTQTLNGTAMAVPRVIVAIIENYYHQETNSILIPEVLREYMDGKERIEKQ